MPRLIDLSGQVFGKLTVLSRVVATGQAKWLCRCECGKTTIQPGYELRAKKVKSCGCYRNSIRGKSSITHGLTKTSEYFTWINMRNRCNRKSGLDYSRYGALGITVCERWLYSFENFIADMGKKPDGYSLDRIDPKGNYTPENCRWASLEVQQINKKRTKYATLNGETKTIIEWCKLLCLSARTIRSRIAAGWEPEKALRSPIRFTNRIY